MEGGVSQVYAHGVVASESFATAGTFACAVGEPVLDTLLAKDVAACFDNRVLEGALANLALEHGLCKN